MCYKIISLVDKIRKHTVHHKLNLTLEVLKLENPESHTMGQEKKTV